MALYGIHFFIPKLQESHLDVGVVQGLRGTMQTHDKVGRWIGCAGMLAFPEPTASADGPGLDQRLPKNIASRN